MIRAWEKEKDCCMQTVEKRRTPQENSVKQSKVSFPSGRTRKKGHEWCGKPSKIERFGFKEIKDEESND